MLHDIAALIVDCAAGGFLVTTVVLVALAGTAQGWRETALLSLAFLVFLAAGLWLTAAGSGM